MGAKTPETRITLFAEVLRRKPDGNGRCAIDFPFGIDSAACAWARG